MVSVTCGPPTTGLLTGVGFSSTVDNLFASIQKKWIEIKIKTMAVNHKTICRPETLC